MAPQSKNPGGKQPESPDQPASKPLPEIPTDNKPDPVQRLTRIILIIVAVLFVWYVAADRLAPWTDQARLQTFIVPIVPQVSGKVLKVAVINDQEVKAGDLLLQIDPTDYRIAVQVAETALEMAGQDLGAASANVASAQAILVESQANLEHMKVQGARIFAVEKKGVLSKSDGDKARAAIKQASAQVESARANLDKARQQMGITGKNNPKIRKAIADLKQAQIDLDRTSLYAPSYGGITNLKIDEGHYAQSGVPIMTFIEGGNVWIQANLRENSVANIKAGNAVDIALDVAPGRVFRGHVTSVGYAVQQESSGEIGGLATIQGNSGWLRDAQRFPVLIRFDDESSKGLRRYGGQVDVQIYTGNNWILNSLGWVWIRTLSLLSYVY
ncbi:MAG TPA: HlyD family secretion protein [Gammaproteobacteria bacterium]|nr:HlyD family secretion protein [Gammaproteobacteria bacterium]